MVGSVIKTDVGESKFWLSCGCFVSAYASGSEREETEMEIFWNYFDDFPVLERM